MKPVLLRELTAEEIAAVEKLAHSRTEAVRRVERARLIWAVHQGEPRSTLAARLRVDLETVRRQVLRFNAEGLASFNDRRRAGRTPAPQTAPPTRHRPAAQGRITCRMNHLNRVQIESRSFC